MNEPEQQDAFTKPPEAINMVVDAIRESKRPMPKMFHANVFQAAEYWIAMQESPDERTERVTATKKNNQITGWLTPYHDRLVYRLKIFLSLKYIYQLFIIDMISRGMPWRGEDIETCKNLIKFNNTRKKAFAEGRKEEYIQTVFKTLKKLRFRDLPYDKNSQEA